MKRLSLMFLGILAMFFTAGVDLAANAAPTFAAPSQITAAQNGPKLEKVQVYCGIYGCYRRAYQPYYYQPYYGYRPHYYAPRYRVYRRHIIRHRYIYRHHIYRRHYYRMHHRCYRHYVYRHHRRYLVRRCI